MTDEGTTETEETAPDDEPASIHDADPYFGMDFDVDAGAIMGMANDIEEAETAETGEMTPDELASYVEALKQIESAAETARKEVFEPALEAHVEVGGTVGNLQRRPGRNTWVKDDEAAFDAVLDAGHDPREVAKVSVSKLRKVLGDKAAAEFIGESEYDYFARQA